MRQVYYIDCAATILERRRWIHEMELLHQQDTDRAMGMVVVLVIVLGILLTFVGLLVMG